MSFSAKYGGRCEGCGRYFDPGEEVSYEGGRTLIAVECCDGLATPAVPARAPAPEAVMPRSRKIADRCDTCFQIPSTTGVCGCS